MVKTSIIIFLSILALIDIIAITYPYIKRNLDTRKKRKSFAKKMKKLEIK